MSTLLSMQFLAATITFCGNFITQFGDNQFFTVIFFAFRAFFINFGSL